jgi:AraC-like DNA-binding protein
MLDKPFCVDIEQDRYKNLWVATENGMFLIPKATESPIPLVSDVEFNRYGLTLFRDKIYAGSINGLYLFDVYEIEKGYLPRYLQKVADQKSIARKNLIKNVLVFGLPIFLIVGWIVRKVYFKKRIQIQPKTEAYSLEKIKQDIIANKIVSVEGLAEHYRTNTVQLNRRFKNLGTTPGKFLKKVKISWAKSLLSEGKPLEEVARIVGYSERLLKIELGLEI